MKVKLGKGDIRVIELVSKSAVTKCLFVNPIRLFNDGKYVGSNPYDDILKVAVTNRYTGRMSIGFVKGVGLKQGAIACSVSHDAHNFVCVGVDDRSMAYAINILFTMGGGFYIVYGDKISASIPLGVDGLMSEFDGNYVAERLIKFREIQNERGVSDLMALSFLSLSVIPDLKLTDKGLISNFQIVPLFTGELNYDNKDKKV